MTNTLAYLPERLRRRKNVLKNWHQADLKKASLESTLRNEQKTFSEILFHSFNTSLTTQLQADTDANGDANTDAISDTKADRDLLSDFLATMTLKTIFANVDTTMENNDVRAFNLSALRTSQASVGVDIFVDNLNKPFHQILFQSFVQ